MNSEIQIDEKKSIWSADKYVDPLYNEYMGYNSDYYVNLSSIDFTSDIALSKLLYELELLYNKRFAYFTYVENKSRKVLYNCSTAPFKDIIEDVKECYMSGRDDNSYYIRYICGKDKQKEIASLVSRVDETSHVYKMEKSEQILSLMDKKLNS